ncbi:MAG: flagellar motor switch protein FliN [Pirellulales bacterium]
MADETQQPDGSQDADAPRGQSQANEHADVPAQSTPAATAKPQPAPRSPADSSGTIAQDDIDLLLNQAEEALRSVNRVDDPPANGARPFELRDFTGASPTNEAATLDLIRDVDLDVTIELGRSRMYLEDVLRLRKGSVVPLDKLAGDPVDIYVNGRLVARGEILVLNDNFCVRVAELIAGEHAA